MGRKGAGGTGLGGGKGEKRASESRSPGEGRDEALYSVASLQAVIELGPAPGGTRKPVFRILDKVRSLRGAAGRSAIRRGP